MEEMCIQILNLYYINHLYKTLQFHPAEMSWRTGRVRRIVMLILLRFSGLYNVVHYTKPRIHIHIN